MTYSPLSDDLLRDIAKRVEEAKRQSARLIDQSHEMFDGTMRLIKQSKKLLFRGKPQEELD